MTPLLLQELRARLPTIRERWEALLRIEPVKSPLANPDALVHLIPSSLEAVMTAVAKRTRVVNTSHTMKVRLPDCDCGCNPYLAYFVAGEQALLEALVLAHTAVAKTERQPSDVAEIVTAIRRLAQSEIDAFCGVCTHRGAASHCRHPTPVA